MTQPVAERFTAIDPAAFTATVDVTDYDDIMFALSSRSFEKTRDKALGSPAILDATVIDIDGAPHTERRRIAAPLFRRVQLKRYDDEALRPAIDHVLARLDEARNADGFARADLGHLAQIVFAGFMTVMIGLDDVFPDHVEEFYECFDPIDDAVRLRYTGGDAGKVEREVDQAFAKFISRFYRASWERRLKLLERAKAGEISEDEIPLDLMTLMAQHREHFDAWDDQVMEREAVVYVSASIANAINTSCSTVDEITRWMVKTGTPREALFDIEFLTCAVEETIRLYPSAPFLLRQVVETVNLPSGLTIESGRVAALQTLSANHAMAGADGTEYNPTREIPRGRPRYGLSFGPGHHHCLGRPLIVGDRSHGTASGARLGTAGIFLRAMFEHGMELDPDNPPLIDPTSNVNKWTTFPVRFAPR